MSKTCPTCKVQKLHRYSGFVEVQVTGLQPEDFATLQTKVTGYVCLKCGVGFFRTKSSEETLVARVSLKRIA